MLFYKKKLLLLSSLVQFIPSILVHMVMDIQDNMFKIFFEFK